MTDWLRLWHDMPTDPKWRVIARKSGQPLPCVIALFNLILVNASTNAADRGTLSGWNDEDAAAALDMDPDDVTAILMQMRGRVIDGTRLTGWERRQPKREDGTASARKQAWLERQEKKQNTSERTRTQENASERAREEEIREDKKELRSCTVGKLTRTKAPSRFDDLWQEYPRRDGSNPKEPARKKFDALCQSGVDPETIIAGAKAYATAERARNNIGTPYIAQTVTWLNQKRWQDALAATNAADARAGPKLIYITPTKNPDEWSAWTKHRGRPFPIDREGGWNVPSLIPPETRQS